MTNEFYIRMFKFRCWHNAKKYMFVPVGLNFLHGRLVTVIESFVLAHPVEAIKLMQFTGLHDKNGNEIFEGDKFYIGGKDKAYVMEPVHFKDGEFLVGTYLLSDIICYFPLVVVGNIFERKIEGE